MKNLTPKQQMFVKEYLVDLNATAAARRAGYKNAEIGRQLIAKNNVAAAIQSAMDKRAAKVGITAEQVLENIERISGKAELDAEYSAALKGQELLGKHLKLFTDRVEHSGPDGGPIQLSAMERANRLAYLVEKAKGGSKE